jgi:hypothetical protein
MRPDSFYDDLVDDVMDDLEADHGVNTEDEAYYGEEAERITLQPPGDCNWLRHAQLQGKVRRLCDMPRACTEAMSCKVLTKRGKRNVRCAGARSDINTECYRGGDQPHQQAAREAAAAANNCRRLFLAKCGSTRTFFE